MKQTAAQKALDVLARCDDGATEDTMLFMHGIPRRVLDGLVKKGELTMQVRHLIKPRPMDVRVYYSPKRAMR